MDNERLLEILESGKTVFYKKKNSSNMFKCKIIKLAPENEKEKRYIYIRFENNKRVMQLNTDALGKHLFFSEKGNMNFDIEKHQIRQYLTKRAINRIYHFTKIDNLYSIFSNGNILSVDALRKLNIDYTSTDIHRYDGRPNYISTFLSLNNPYLKRCLDKKDFSYIIIEIDSSILWEKYNDVLYCYTNAANKNISNLKDNQLNTFGALQKVFKDEIEYTVVNYDAFGMGEPYPRKFNRLKNNRHINEPTCLNSEFMIKDKIPIDYINKIWLGKEITLSNYLKGLLTKYNVDYEKRYPFG